MHSPQGEERVAGRNAVRLEQIARQTNRMPFAGGLRRGRLVVLMMLLAASGLAAKDGVGVSLRVVDEVAPAGGLALVRLELTEPKPISGGRISMMMTEFFAPSAGETPRSAAALGAVQAVGLLSRSGDVRGSVTLGQAGAIVDFSSPRSTYGTDLDLPIAVFAIPVSAGAAPGSTATLSLDLSGSQFLDTEGKPYAVEVKPGTFSVGGVSIVRVVAPGDNLEAGASFVLEGLGFQAGARVQIEGADLAARVAGPTRIELVTGTALNLDNAAIRLRNPDGSDDFFCAIPALRQTTTGSGSEVRFASQSLTMVAGTVEELALSMSPALPQAGTVRVSSSAPSVLDVPASVAVAAGASTAKIRIAGLAAGAAGISVTLGSSAATLQVRVVPGAVYRIPVLRSDSTAQVGLAITNSGTAPAEVRLRGYSGAVSSAAEATVERFVSLASRGQVSRFLGQYDPGFAGFRGWVEVSSQSTDVHAMFLNAPAAVLAFDGASNPVVAGDDIVFPQSSLDADGDFDFILLNPTPREAVVTLQWRDSSGQLTRTRAIAPLGTLAESVAGAFGLIGRPGNGYLRIASTEKLGAFQQHSTGRMPFGQVPPAVVSPARDFYLPQFAAGAGWETALTLVNPGNAVVDVTLSLLADDGSLVKAGGSRNPVVVQVPGNSQIMLRGREVFALPAGALTAGSIAVTSSGLLVGAAAISDTNANGFVTGVPLDTRLVSEAVFAQVATGNLGGIGYFTGLALQNPGVQSTTVDLEVFANDGTPTGRSSIVIPAGGRLARLLSELVPALSPQTGGHIRLRSSLPVAMLEIFGTDRLDFLTTVTPSVIR